MCEGEVVKLERIDPIYRIEEKDGRYRVMYRVTILGLWQRWRELYVVSYLASDGGKPARFGTLTEAEEAACKFLERKVCPWREVKRGTI